MEKIRSFIAISIPQKIKEELEKVESSLIPATSASVKWVAPSTMHLTLKFLGDIEVTKIEAIADTIRKAASNTQKIRLEVQGLGVYPHVQRTQIAWAGLSGDLEDLIKLQRSIDRELEKLGFSLDQRKFSPHLTIARVRDRANPEERITFGRLITGTTFDAGTFMAESVQLMKSLLTRQGPIYTELASVSLS